MALFSPLDVRHNNRTGVGEEVGDNAVYPLTAAGRREGQQVAVPALAEPPALLAAQNQAVSAEEAGPAGVVQVREAGGAVAVRPRD